MVPLLAIVIRASSSSPSLFCHFNRPVHHPSLIDFIDPSSIQYIYCQIFNSNPYIYLYIYILLIICINVFVVLITDSGGGGRPGSPVGVGERRSSGSGGSNSRLAEDTLAYTVQSNDTLTSLAARFDTTPSELVAINKLHSRLIFPGQVILCHSFLQSLIGQQKSRHLALISIDPQLLSYVLYVI